MKFWHKSRAITLVQKWVKQELSENLTIAPLQRFSCRKWTSTKDIEQKQISDINQGP